MSFLTAFFFSKTVFNKYTRAGMQDIFTSSAFALFLWLDIYFMSLPELKAQVTFSDHLSSVCLFIWVCTCIDVLKKHFLENSTKLGTSNRWLSKYLFKWIKSHTSLQGEIVRKLYVAFWNLFQNNQDIFSPNWHKTSLSIAVHFFQIR